MSGHEYEEALERLSSLISSQTRADSPNKVVEFARLFEYLKMLDLEDAMSQLKVIHVAGTKGKGSTCAFAESILRTCGFRTGLFTSPHLIDIRERYKLDGCDVSEEKFVEYFWWCWHRLQERTDNNIPMPSFFWFIALLAFKMFIAEKVDVAILEVGLGGRFDATNVVRAPVVCGVSSLGYDHMEILGNTLQKIAGDKAGIFKEGVAAYTVPQPEEAMSALKQQASELDILLVVVPPLDVDVTMKGQKLGLAGEHQHLNAGLAVALCRAFLKNTGNAQHVILDDMNQLPEEFIRGLASTNLPGRAQIVPDPPADHLGQENKKEGLTFYLDGAHSPESMEVCARWFCCAIREKEQLSSLEERAYNHKQILIFNCMPVRDPKVLLPRLRNACAECGIYFHKAIFVPNQSVLNKVVSHATPLKDPPQADVSWQQTVQRVWKNLKDGDNGPDDVESEDGSSVLPSLPLAIEGLRKTSEQNPSICFEVLVTGSLHLVGEVMRLINRGRP